MAVIIAFRQKRASFLSNFDLPEKVPRSPIPGSEREGSSDKLRLTS